MSDEETVNLLQCPIEVKRSNSGRNFGWGLPRIDYMSFKRILANLYYEWNNPVTYVIMVCINTYIILSCLFYTIVPTPAYVLEIFVMITFTFELSTKAILLGPKALWEKDGKIDTIAYVMCFISMFGTWDFSIPEEYVYPDQAHTGDKYAKIFVVSFRIIAQLIRLFRAIICHYKAKFKCDDRIWIEMDETLQPCIANC